MLPAFAPGFPGPRIIPKEDLVSGYKSAINRNDEIINDQLV